MQRFTSKNTSINSKKLPAVYTMKSAIEIYSGKSIIDIGGGKFDNAIDHVKLYDSTLSIYDKYNRCDTHNNMVLDASYDIAIISNVLNVIAEFEERKNVLKLAASKARTVLITVYEGDKSGIGRQTSSDAWQENRILVSYIKEISDVFTHVERKGRLIIAHNN